MYKGTKIELGDKEYILPALSLDQLQNGGGIELLKSHDEIKAENDNALKLFMAKAQIIHMALTRNYPNVGMDEVMKGLDLNNVNEIWNMSLGASGINVGEATATGTTAAGT